VTAASSRLRKGAAGQSRTDAKPLTARVRRGALWSVASAAQLRATNIVTTAVVAHILDPRQFGIFAVALTAYSIVYSLGEFGVGGCLVRADLDIDALAPTLNTVAVSTSVVQAGAMVLFARPIATALGSSAAADPISAMALVVLIIGVFTVPSTRLIRDFRQDKVFLAEVTSVVGSVAVLLCLAKSGSGAMAFAWSRVVGQLISGCVMFISCPRNYRFGFTRSAMSVLLKTGLPFGFAGFVNYVLLNVDYALISRLLGATHLGIYVLAFNVATWPSSLLGFMISTISIPALSRVKHDPDRFKNAVTGALRAMSLLVFPMSAFIMALARPLVLTLYGAKWLASAEILTILAVYGAASILCTFFASVLASAGKNVLLLTIQLIWIVALVPAIAFGVRWDGITGAAYAHVAVIVPIVLPCYLVFLRKTIRVRYAELTKAVSGALPASLAAAVVARVAASMVIQPVLQLLVGLALGGLVYLVIVAPQVIVLIDQVQDTGSYGRRISRFYRNAARLLGLPSANGPKHARRGQSGGVQRDELGAPGARFSVDAPSVTDATRASQLAALAVLMDLAGPVPQGHRP
jgi:lipopolysaccharide exporter